ncbi:MAG: BspA family leucine-rich repeat surface protein [Lachnospiraceae bacterium]|nr:BspA family leucine-rich repeat surface protein [Lachnospiraceae bacterium]
MREKQSCKIGQSKSAALRIMGALAAVLLGIFMFNARNVKAYAEEEPIWEGFKYILDTDEHIIMLWDYIGEDTTINVPSTATIEGVEYRVCLCNDFFIWNPEVRERIESFSVGEGVIVDRGESLFDGFKKLKKVDLSKAVTGEYFNDMSWLFNGCEELEKADISGLNTENVTSMHMAFQGCHKLTDLKLGNNFKTGNVTDMMCMFNECYALKSIDVSGFDTRNVEYMDKMFADCRSLEKLDLSSFNTAKVISAGCMFYRCTNLKTIIMGENFKMSAISSTGGVQFMFSECENLEALDLSKWELTEIAEDTESEETVISMFGGNDKLEEFILPNSWGNVDKIDLAKYMFMKTGDTIGNEEYGEATKLMAGKTMVAFPTKERVKIETVNKTAVYDGLMIDISDMFKLPEGLEVKSYSADDDVSLNLVGCMAEVFKAGKYTVSVITRETERYEEGSASAILTVKRAKGTGNITVSDVNEGTNVSPSASSSTNPGDPTFFYKKKGTDDKYYSAKVPTEAGEYTVMALFPDADLYECSVTADFKIIAEKGESENKNDNPYAEYGLDDKYVPDGYVDNSGSEMIKKDQEDCSWNPVNGKSYWYESGIKQGTYYDPNGVLGEDPETHVATIRGREIYDSKSDGWYWLDSCYDGAKAIGKEVWIPYIYQDEAGWDDAKMREVANEADEGMRDLVYQFMKEKKGKWVRYDKNGSMLKGWVTIEGDLADLYPDQAGKVYYYDHKTGLMAKGEITIDGVTYHFDERTGERL